ncbi:MAG: hypothetical protein WAO12_03805 [Venatoribacter sp.]
MIWIMVAGILAVVGSILMLKPNARDSRLAKLRMDALKEGLQVRQFIWQPKAEKTGVYNDINATSYSYARPLANKPGALKFSISKQKGWESEGLPEGYSWYQVGTAADAARFQQQLAQLNDEILLLEVWENKALLMAAEKPGASALGYKQLLESFL